MAIWLLIVGMLLGLFATVSSYRMYLNLQRRGYKLESALTRRVLWKAPFIYKKAQGGVFAIITIVAGISAFCLFLLGCIMLDVK
jgi:hypothetical protein